MDQIDEKYLSPTSIIDSDHRRIIEHARETIGDGTKDPVEMAVKLYYWVRDGIRYDPYYPFFLPEHYRASNILKSRRGYCVCKASLLCALGRASRIPTRVGFADVKNHLATKELAEFMGSDLFVYHGFVEFYLEGKWVKSTPAFNIELCNLHRVKPLEFNGREDSLFHPYNLEKKLFMEYVEFHDIYHDIPLDKIMAAWNKTYGEERVKRWIRAVEASGGKTIRDFYRETVI